MCFLGYYGIEQADEGGGELCVASCWEHYGPRLGQGPQSTRWMVWPCSQLIKGGGNFYKLDNPGGWSRLSYRPVFAYGAQGGQYKAHCFPAGCQSVMPNEYDTAIFSYGGWIFSTKGGRRGETRMWWGRKFLKKILLHGLMCKRIYFLESVKDACMRSYQRS